MQSRQLLSLRARGEFISRCRRATTRAAEGRKMRPGRVESAPAAGRCHPLFTGRWLWAEMATAWRGAGDFVGLERVRLGSSEPAR